MPRRHPAPRRPTRPSAQITGLSLTACRELDRLGIRAVVVAGDLAAWKQTATMPVRDLNRPHGDQLHYIAPFARDGLEHAMRALPARRARELRALVEPVDEVVLRRTAANPRASSDLPWWHRRWTD